MQIGDIKPATPPQLWELIVKSLRIQIFSGKIPPGTQLVEGDLAAMFGVSRGPIRDAIFHLEQERLITREPRRGAYVRGVTENDVREIYGLRQVLENYAAEFSCGRFSSEDLQEMQSYIDQMVDLRRGSNWEESAELDLEFHRIPMRVSGHRRLLRSWELLAGSVFALTAVTAPNYPDLIQETRRGHQVMLDAYARGDVDAVKEAIAVHMAKTQEVMLRMVRAVIGEKEVSAVTR